MSTGVEKPPPPDEAMLIVAPEIDSVPFDTLMSRTMLPPGETVEGLGVTDTVNVGRGFIMILVCPELPTKPALLAATVTLVDVEDVTAGAVKLETYTPGDVITCWVKLPPRDDVNAKTAPDTGAVPLVTVVIKVETSPERRIEGLPETETWSFGTIGPRA